MKICIVGGVAGGASAATRLRRLSEDAEIVLFEKGEYISYANCGLPYYIGGSIKSKDALLVTKPELLRNRFRVDVRVRNEVLSIDRKAKTVQVRDHAAGRTYTEPYDKLILSPGAEPKRPNLPGVELDGVFTLRTVPDTFRIDQYIREKNAASAVVVGGGFIGVEMAENLKERGLDVSIVEFADQVVAPLDKEMANLLHRHLTEHGVRLRLGTGLTGIEEKSGALAVSLTKGEPLRADLVLLSMGVAPENRLAKEAGLQLGVGNSIAVNEFYQTSDPDIYAVGDAIGVKNLVTGQENLVPLAGPANKQGRIAAENVLGAQKTTGEGLQGSSVLKVFDLTAASTGLNEKQARAQGIAYRKTYVHPQSHASYYPGATPITMKLLFAEDGKVLGAQAVGYEGVEKRIDVLATVIRLHGTVYDLEELELCYAPPYSSAKDPVNMLGFTAANILKGDMPVIYAEDVPALDPEQTTRLDVSMPEEVRMGTVPGFRNLPLDELRGRLNELDPKNPVYVTCRVGLRGYLATRILKQHGFDAYNLSGGYKTYQLVHAKNVFAEPPAPQKPKEERTDHDVKTIAVDACGLQCPGPIMKVAEGMKSIAEGEQLRVRATDPAFASDIQAWCKSTGNQLLSVQNEKGTYEVVLQKGCGANPAPSCAIASEEGHDKTMVIFSGDLDKAIAAFIIANGAAAMGRKVTLFFTFWGLNILRKSEKVRVKKNVIEKMFGVMMPRGSKKLKLSKMHMAGAGSKMIREVMKRKNVSSLEELIQSAMDNGVRVVACQMSMDIMGIRAEELLDGVELGGVATFLGSAETSDTNLFI
ncbi:DsrE/DsrF/DrsH-like family protein [Anaeromassilibacillus senegalensis]|uniref:DsrE/DsrF/DrsH-like family protein n=1 Tax=Anaeromassilibacillus senegalensis TaxID=1673717 RepID=UPI000680E499|nr:DsrE/DsrF/DrsH-like family protein [Anaeromassilibacillus senegalensis]